MDYLHEAKANKLQLAIASSSEMPWVNGHLIRLGIRDYFDFVHTVDEIGIPKPDPALYQACFKFFRSETGRSNCI